MHEPTSRAANPLPLVGERDLKLDENDEREDAHRSRSQSRPQISHLNARGSKTSPYPSNKRRYRALSESFRYSIVTDLVPSDTIGHTIGSNYQVCCESLVGLSGHYWVHYRGITLPDYQTRAQDEAVGSDEAAAGREPLLCLHLWLQCVRLCPDVSRCVRSCPIVSGRVRLCPVVSGHVRSETGGFLAHVILSG